jgi:hypothetical protein
MNHGPESKDMEANTASLTPLDQEVRDILPTGEAARHLNRSNQTLRKWACLQTGPISPVRVHGRLGWRTADLRRLVGAEAA